MRLLAVFFAFASVLLEIILKVLCDALVQVHALVAHHVVAFAGVGIEVGLGAGIDAGLDEHEAVLGHHGGVVVPGDDLQLALEVFGLGKEGGLGIAFGVGLGGVHIALAIHHFVPLPVDDGAACHAYLEHVGVVGHERDGHEASEAPAVHADAGGIDIGEALEVLDTAHLIEHFLLAQLTEGSLLEGLTTVLATAVVEDEGDVALLCHVGLPRAAAIVPAGIDEVGMGASVDVDYDGVLLALVEVGRAHHAPVEVGGTVCCLEAATAELGHLVAFPGVGRREVGGVLEGAGIGDLDVAGHLGSLVAVGKVAAAGAEGGGVPALAIVEEGALAGGYAHLPGVALDGAALVAADDDALGLGVEAYEVEHDPAALGELAQLVAFGVEEVEVVVAVALALKDELAGVPGEEGDGVLGLDVLGIGLAVELGKAVACGGVVAHEAAVVLVAIELEEVDGLRIGAPSHVGEVAVLGVASLEVVGGAGGHVIDAHGDLVGGLPRHGVLVGLVGGDVGEEVHLRVVGDHALVHAVEGEAHAVGAPEEAAVDAELVAVHALSVYDLARTVGGELYVATAIGRAEVELVAIDVGRVARCGVEAAGLILCGTALLPHQLLLLEVDELALAAKVEQHQGLVGIGEAGVVEGAQAALGGEAQPLVDLGNGEEGGLFARLLVHEVALLHVEAHEMVAPPGEPAVLGHHVAVVGAAKVEVFQCKLFQFHSLLCCDARDAECQQGGCHDTGKVLDSCHTKYYFARRYTFLRNRQYRAMKFLLYHIT